MRSHTNSTSYLDSLNEKQREAAEATEGPVIVLAGAGSGKTKMLITRIAHLLHLGHHPSSILAMTFTNKAAAEMKSRVLALMQSSGMGQVLGGWSPPWGGFSARMPEVSTFHSFCVKLLRTEADALGLTRPFTIYDDDDQTSLLKAALESEQIDAKNVKRFRAAIDQLKCQALGPEDIDPDQYSASFGEQLKKVYVAYQMSLRASQAFDFNDLIIESYKLLARRPDILTKYQEQFRYIMVDEYQDTNRAQYLLVNILAQKYRNLCVVGDEDQSIYKWRGADIKNILDFKKDFPEAKMVKLEQNYRSTQTIINAASAVIKNNSSRYDKTLWTANEQGEKIRWAQVSDERAEAEYVTKELRRWLERNHQHGVSDVAIFYRSHAQSRALEESFRRARITYKIIGSVGFYERKEIKDMLAYLRVLVNPDDSVSITRIINTPARGIGKTTVEKVEEYARGRQLSFYAGLRKMLEEGAESLPPSAKKKLVEFLKLVDSFRDLATRTLVSDLYHHILDATGYVTELKAENTDEAKARIQNLEELDNVIQYFEEESGARSEEPGQAQLQAFLSQVTLEASILEKDENSAAGYVSFMSLHSSKGLEFPLVFLVGCEEGIFPSRQASDEMNPEGIEEERRLCYVGITRAKKTLFISSAQMRRIYGQMQVSAPSRFIREIPESLLAVEMHRGESSVAQSWQQRQSYGSGGGYEGGSRLQKSKPQSHSGRYYDYSEASEPSEPAYKVKKVETAGGGMQVGQKVRHSIYGVGTVKSLEGSESDRKVMIEFPQKLMKKFSLKHVELEVL